MPRFALSVDIGGTFTDFVLQDRERRMVFTDKVLTTPNAPEQAIFAGMDLLAERSGLTPASCDLFLHATTIITNAVIERKGRDFIFVYTEGFRTTLETGREHRYDLTNLKLRFPEPLARDDLKVSVAERVSALGEIVQFPSCETVVSDIERLVAQTGVKNFAVCFLHSYRNAANEEAVRDWILDRFPDAYVSMSAGVAPAQREYERWTTCAVNAYTMPILADYVRRLEGGLAERGFRDRGLMMTSSGLPLSFDHCVRYPVRLIESGPAAGVLAARAIAARNADVDGAGDAANVLAYDMGGTTAKGAFLTAGEVHVQSALEVDRVGAFKVGSGLPLMIPAIDLIEIGAGGGSIARMDERGAIAVGPRSAGADPGPACYGRGGEQATLTDANLVLGLLSEANFRNSGIEASAALAREAVERNVARPLGISTDRAARGIHNTVNENVARAFRVHAAELGIDYRRYTLVSTGGSSSLHTIAIARILNIRRVIFPFGAGVSSAFGLFTGREGIALQKTRLVRLDRATRDDVVAQVDGMVAGERVASALAAGGGTISLTLGMRYERQGYETAVKIGPDRTLFEPAAIHRAFEGEYRKIFGLTFPDHAIEIVNWTVEVSQGAALSELEGYRYENVREGGAREKGVRTVLGERAGRALAVPVLDRYALRPGEVIAGPALVEENDTTIYIPAGSPAVVAPSLDLIADLEAQP
ncbi:Acetophenone carboxylase gamma subunit [Methylobacterium crusticola]|uniref:Acetophenone carboxylase gamma subunit n=1 Tax=Methylobacterium crusticola TaxID=1697972 RepID=A0ABQ4R9R2_9HYPH|nr:hydantoinase/oxoprolinase family protein [Methylobacterium crusticola]GJD53984.1 Acetophenone carboxylase gamma subunit [Methylobacterium crusticola]